jgi:hypothetical protein
MISPYPLPPLPILPPTTYTLHIHPTSYSTSHSALNREFFSDTCWTLSMYLEAVAMLPQIFMFQKQASEEGGTVEALIGHTVFALGFARVFELIFWLGSFKELSDHAGSRYELHKSHLFIPPWCQICSFHPRTYSNCFFFLKLYTLVSPIRSMDA